MREVLFVVGIVWFACASCVVALLWAATRKPLGSRTPGRSTRNAAQVVGIDPAPKADLNADQTVAPKHAAESLHREFADTFATESIDLYLDGGPDGVEDLLRARLVVRVREEALEER